MPFETVIVIGGGLAGLSCAVALAESGCRVRMFEKRPHLGGRATSYSLPDGSHVDNCQHLTLGCCTNLDDFYRRVGAAGKIRYYNRYIFADRAGRRSSIEPSALPPPFHFAPSFLLFPALSWKDKLGIGRALLEIARSGGRLPSADGVSMLDWLRSRNQTPNAIDRFWRCALVSALDETLDRADARYGIDFYWKTFLANRLGGRIGLPSVPLGELYDGCRAAVERQGGEVRSRAGVRSLCVSDGRVTGLLCEDGSQHTADAYVAAVTHDALLGMLPSDLIERETCFSNLRNLRTSPITGVHLWFDRPVMYEPYLTLLDHTVQWIFNKTRLSANSDSAAPEDAAQYLQLVISASYDLVPRPRQEIVNLCLAELSDVFSAVREARLVKSTVIKEVAATFSPFPGVDRWRPPQQSPLPNLFLAGDWTKTGWPSTMEGAVRSGYLSAESLLASASRPRHFVVPDLPAESLSLHWSRR
jgi:squalene-associated FAD-dependent desaturase